MNRISLNDYERTVFDNGKEVYTLSQDTVRKLGKKRMAGVPNTVTVHIPIAEEATESLDNTFAEFAVKVIGRALGI